MGATLLVHRLQNQIESYDFTAASRRGGLWAGMKNIIAHVEAKEHSSGVKQLNISTQHNCWC